MVRRWYRSEMFEIAIDRPVRALHKKFVIKVRHKRWMAWCRIHVDEIEEFMTLIKKAYDEEMKIGAR